MWNKKSSVRKRSIWRRAAVLAACTLCIFARGVKAAGENQTLGLEENLKNLVLGAEDPYDLLLIGVDRRDESWYGNSDVMVLVTVNPKQERIYLTSFLRDLYADIPGVGVSKLNAACASGGPELCVETIESTYKVEIDNYAMVDFNDMIHIVDIFGGIDLELTEDEAKVANGYIRTMCEADQEPYELHKIEGAGLQHLDGYQTVGYARNRYSGSGSDFGRTMRQRKILKAILEQVRKQDLASVASMGKQAFSYLEHDISGTKLVWLISQIPGWLEYDLEEQSIPYEGMYRSENELLIPDLEATIEKLHNTIYS